MVQYVLQEIRENFVAVMTENAYFVQLLLHDEQPPYVGDFGHDAPHGRHVNHRYEDIRH